MLFNCCCLKGFGYKCLGVVMRKSTHKKFVQDHLKLMFSTVRHGSQIEREVSVCVCVCMRVCVRACVRARVCVHAIFLVITCMSI